MTTSCSIPVSRIPFSASIGVEELTMYPRMAYKCSPEDYQKLRDTKRHVLFDDGLLMGIFPPPGADQYPYACFKQVDGETYVFAGTKAEYDIFVPGEEGDASCEFDYVTLFKGPLSTFVASEGYEKSCASMLNGLRHWLAFYGGHRIDEYCFRTLGLYMSQFSNIAYAEYMVILADVAASLQIDVNERMCLRDAIRLYEHCGAKVEAEALKPRLDTLLQRLRKLYPVS